MGTSASNTAAVTTPVPPLAISGLQPYGIATTSAVLSLGAQFNERHRRTSLGDAWPRKFSLVTTLPAGSTGYVDSSLQPGTLYEYHVFGH